ncbi:MAG: signal peptidase II [Candidatus Buchananbacteria bacterium]
MKKLSTAITLLAPIAVFILDRCLKWLFTHPWSEAVFTLWGRWLSLRLAYNSGAAFGLPIYYLLMIGAHVLALFVLTYYGLIFYRRRDNRRLTAVLLAGVGAFSNFLDRWHWGQVIDYIDLRYFSVFNLADCAIVCGLVFLAWSLYRQEAK